MRGLVLVLVIFAVFASVVLAARKPEQKNPSSENLKETNVRESPSGKTPAKKPLKKEPHPNKPNLNKKPPIPQSIKEEQFEEEAMVEEKPAPANKKPAVSTIKHTNEKISTADASVPQPPKRGDKPPTPIKLKPDVVENELSFELPRPPSPPVA